MLTKKIAAMFLVGLVGCSGESMDEESIGSSQDEVSYLAGSWSGTTQLTSGINSPMNVTLDLDCGGNTGTGVYYYPLPDIECERLLTLESSGLYQDQTNSPSCQDGVVSITLNSGRVKTKMQFVWDNPNWSLARRQGELTKTSSLVCFPN